MGRPVRLLALVLAVALPGGCRCNDSNEAVRPASASAPAPAPVVPPQGLLATLSVADPSATWAECRTLAALDRVLPARHVTTAVATWLGLPLLAAGALHAEAPWSGAFALSPNGKMQAVLAIKASSSRRLVTRLTTGTNAPFARRQSAGLIHLDRRDPEDGRGALAVARGHLVVGSDADALRRLALYAATRTPLSKRGAAGVTVRRSETAWTENMARHLRDQVLRIISAGPTRAPLAAFARLLVDRATRIVADSTSAVAGVKLDAEAWRLHVRFIPRAETEWDRGLARLDPSSLDRLLALPRSVRFAAGVRIRSAAAPAPAGDGGPMPFAPRYEALFPRGLSAGLLDAPEQAALFALGPGSFEPRRFRYVLETARRPASRFLDGFGVRVERIQPLGGQQAVVAIRLDERASDEAELIDLDVAWAGQDERTAIALAPAAAPRIAHDLLVDRSEDETLASLPLIEDATRRLGPRVGAAVLARFGRPGSRSGVALAALGRKRREAFVHGVLSRAVVEALLRVLMEEVDVP